MDLDHPGQTTFPPFAQFLTGQASGGILLILATILAFVWANSAWRESYFALREVPLTLTRGAGR